MNRSRITRGVFVCTLMLLATSLRAEPATSSLPHADNRFPGYQFAYPPTMIFDSKQSWQHAREPVLRRMPDGSLLCLHYTGGPREPHDENVVVATRSTDDGVTWSKAETLFDHPERATWATEIFLEAGPPKIFVHTFTAASHYNELRASISHSADDGKTWSEPVTLPGGGNSGVVRRGLVLADGTWLFPIYFQEQVGKWHWKNNAGQANVHWQDWVFRCAVLRSIDQGKTFTQHGYLKSSFTPPGATKPQERLLWEPAVVELAPNKLVMFMRAEAAGVLYRADSADGGLTWSEPLPTDIADAGSKFSLFKFGDAIAMLHNPSPQTGWPARNSLELWVSRDGCNTWPVKQVLARSPNGKACCYPDGFADAKQQLLYVAVDTGVEHFLMKIPFAAFLSP